MRAAVARVQDGLFWHGLLAAVSFAVATCALAVATLDPVPDQIVLNQVDMPEHEEVPTDGP